MPFQSASAKQRTLVVVGDAGQAVLAPAVGDRAGLVVTEIVPGVAAVAVVLANGPPLPLAQVRAPLSPGRCLRARFRQSPPLVGHLVLVGRS